MSFYKELDLIMRQDLGGRGLLSSLPPNPVMQTAHALSLAHRVILLTGFPVLLPDGTFAGETDGPSGTANLAAALLALGCHVHVVTDKASYRLMEEALSYRAGRASLTMLPEKGTDDFIKDFTAKICPTHFISLERPGKAADHHFHNMRGQIIDDMITDSSSFLTNAKKAGAFTIAIGDGGNEMGMGFYRKQIVEHVPSGELICAGDCADLVLASGVSNWWGWGLSALLSSETSLSLLPSAETETELLKRVVNAGGVDGCTKEQSMTVDALSLATHLSVLEQVTALVKKYGVHLGTPSETEAILIT